MPLIQFEEPSAAEAAWQRMEEQKQEIRFQQLRANGEPGKIFDPYHGLSPSMRKFAIEQKEQAHQQFLEDAEKYKTVDPDTIQKRKIAANIAERKRLEYEARVEKRERKERMKVWWERDKAIRKIYNEYGYKRATDSTFAKHNEFKNPVMLMTWAVCEYERREGAKRAEEQQKKQREEEEERRNKYR